MRNAEEDMRNAEEHSDEMFGVSISTVSNELFDLRKLFYLFPQLYNGEKIVIIL